MVSLIMSIVGIQMSSESFMDASFRMEGRVGSFEIGGESPIVSVRSDCYIS